MFKLAIPVLHVSDSVAATEFYCEGLGFHQGFAYRPFGGADPCYMAVSRDEARFHLSSFSGDGIAGGVVFLIVDDVDELYRELVARGISIDLPPTDQSWGNREMYVHDRDVTASVSSDPGMIDNAPELFKKKRAGGPVKIDENISMVKERYL